MPSLQAACRLLLVGSLWLISEYATRISGGRYAFKPEHAAPSNSVLQYRELRESSYWKTAKGRARIVVVLGEGCGTETPPPLQKADDALPDAPSFALDATGCADEGPCPVVINGSNYSAGIKLSHHGVSNHGNYKLAYSAVFRRALNEIRRTGWNRFDVVAFDSPAESEKVPKADMVIAPWIEYNATLRHRYPNSRWIVIHTDDSATINFDLDVDSLDIVGVLMHTSYRDLLENNKAAPYRRRHSAYLLKNITDEKAAERNPPISPRNLHNKVHTIIPQIMRWMHPEDCGGSEDFEVFARHAFGRDESFAPPLSSRPIDLLCLGAIGEEEVISKALSKLANATVYKKSTRSKIGSRAHRLAAASNVRHLASRHNLTAIVVEGRVSYNQYLQLLRQTKIFVSPFGLGEFSGKDYEAILAGAMLVKPLASKLEAYPNIYQSGITLETAADFSDLEHVIKPFLNNPTHLANKGQHMVSTGQRVLERHRSMHRFAQDFNEVLEHMILKHPIISDL